MGHAEPSHAAAVRAALYREAFPGTSLLETGLWIKGSLPLESGTPGQFSSTNNSS